MKVRDRRESNLEAQLAEKPTLPRGIVSIIVRGLLFVDDRGEGAVLVVDDLLNETKENGNDESSFECLPEYEEEYGD